MERLEDIHNAHIPSNRKSANLNEAMETLRGHMAGMMDQNVWLLAQLEKVNDTISNIKQQRQGRNTEDFPNECSCRGIRRQTFSKNTSHTTSQQFGNEHIATQLESQRTVLAPIPESTSLDHVTGSSCCCERRGSEGEET